MREHELFQKQTERKLELLQIRWNNTPGVDWDIWNLEYLLTTIHPYSSLWRDGTVRSLRRAIRALERENREKEAKE